MTKTVRLDPLVEDRPKRLKDAVKADFGLSTSGEQIVASLLHGITTAQLAGMLMAFNKWAAEQGEGTADADAG